MLLQTRIQAVCQSGTRSSGRCVRHTTEGPEIRRASAFLLTAEPFTQTAMRERCKSGNPDLPLPSFDSRLALRPSATPQLELVNAELKPDGEFRGVPRYRLELGILNAGDSELNTANLVVQNFKTNRMTNDREPAGGTTIDMGVISPGRILTYDMTYHHSFRVPLEEGYSSFVVEVQSGTIQKEVEVLATSEVLLDNQRN